MCTHLCQSCTFLFLSSTEPIQVCVSSCLFLSGIVFYPGMRMFLVLWVDSQCIWGSAGQPAAGGARQWGCGPVGVQASRLGVCQNNQRCEPILLGPAVLPCHITHAHPFLVALAVLRCHYTNTLTLVCCQSFLLQLSCLVTSHTLILVCIAILSWSTCPRLSPNTHIQAGECVHIARSWLGAASTC
jgi:hypothetical protein